VSADGALRVLHVHSGNLYGGVERVLEALAHAPSGGLVDSSFAICFDGRVRRELAAAGADLHCLGTVRLRRPDQVGRARGRLRSVVERLRPDVAIVHSSWAQAIFGPVVAAAGVPLARWMHAPEPGPAWLEWWAGRSRPSMVLHNSRYTQARAAGVADAAQTKVVYPPLRASAASAGARAHVRSVLGVAEDVVVIAIAARLEPWKGHRRLFEAFAGMPASNRELWVIGGVQRPPEREYLDALVLDAARRGVADRVRFLGEREDVARLLAAADIYCQPNTGAEPFGISFVEALAAGIPVVTTRLGAAPEIVDDSCGRLVDPSDPAALTSTLAALAADADVRQRLGRAGVARAAQFSDLTVSTARLAEAIRSVVELPVPS
jgi:glycosyltransferase involved in cell wall biosynthesis